LHEPAALPAAADTLDELCFAVRRDAGLRLDPALGFDFYAADVALQARAQGQAVAVVDAFCEHRSRLPRAGFTEAFIERFSTSATHFQNKWRHLLPIATPSITLTATPSAAEQVRAVTGAAREEKALAADDLGEDVLGTDPNLGSVPKTSKTSSPKSSAATPPRVPHWRWELLLSELVFRVVLPLAARLPLALGAGIATLRGRRDAQMDRDWRSLSLRHPYVKAATTRALEELSGAGSPQTLEQVVTQRFVTASLEEWQAHLIMAGRAPQLRMDLEGIDPALLRTRATPGTVWMTAHFDSVMLGIVHMGLAGASFNLMTSTVVEDERIPHSIQRYYVRKYAAMARYFNGGRALQAERHLKSFYAGVREGRSAVVLVDAPALKKEEGLLLEFLGKPRYMAPGAVRLAEFTGAPMGAFLCIQVSPDHYRLVVHPPITPGPGGYPAAAQQLYDFMSRHIMQQPGRWWAADLLPTMIRGD
jgi:lauroyl/myristoyl acyltransferase